MHVLTGLLMFFKGRILQQSSVNWRRVYINYNFYAKNTRSNTRSLVTANKHVNNIRAIAWQPPITTEGLLEAVFSTGPAPRLYDEDLKPAECSSSGATGCGR
jgi:hypothetical protein